jgi:Flp pilus assembly protein TadD
LLNSGLDLYRDGAAAEAATVFGAAVAAAPDYADARRLRGLALLRAGETQAGVADLARAVRLAPFASLAHLHHGIGLMALGRHGRAAARFRRAAMLAPEDPAPWINFAAALLALEQPKAARAAARRALRLEPGNFDAMQALARGHAAAGDAEAAEALLRRLVRTEPKRSAAWVDLGLLHARRGAMEAARAALRAALAADPACSAAAATLAGFSVLSGAQEEAIAALRGVLARDPGCVAARLNLANALLLDRDAAGAAAVLAGKPPPGREGAHWRAALALALTLLARDAEAAALLDEIRPPWGDAEILIVNRRLQLARRARDAATADDLAARLEALSGEERFLFEHRIIACFDLGRLFHEAGERPRAFAQWRRGHDLLKRLQPFSRPTHRDFIDASIAAFDAALLRDGPRAGTTDETAVFIVGLPRSGTTLTEQILASHRDAHGGGERPALHDLILARTGTALRAESARRLAAFDAAALDEMAAGFLAGLRREAASDARRITDKMPANALHLGFIARLLPRARIILCTRDPRDIALSIFQLRFFGYHPYAHDLADLAWYIAEHERLMAHWRRVLPPGHLMEVALTDWTDDFAGTLARVLEFVDLPHDPACERFHENTRLVRTASAAQIREKVHRRGIGRWRGYAAELAPVLEALGMDGA